MDFLTTLYNGVSGVNAMSHRLNVSANNVANINTSAFKTSMATFADRINTTAGSVAVGHGVQLGAINTSFTPGSLENTSRSTDMAISGAGFFVLREGDSITADRYTRNGEFRLTPNPGTDEDDFNLTSPLGQFVQGYNFGSSTGTPTTVSDVIINRTTPQSPTAQVNVSVNLEDNPSWRESVDTPLFSRWDGRNSSAPIAADSFEYSTSLKIFGSDPGATSSSLSDSLNIYFDSTANSNEKEFLVTCQPSFDHRLIDGGASRYTSVSDKGAGALLYGILSFSPGGQLNNIQCWEIPPDGNVSLDPASMLTIPRGESYFNFDFNFGGAAANDTSTINFGSVPRPQAVTSPASASATASGSSPIHAYSRWDSMFDSLGNKVKAGDTIRFQGRSGDGTRQDYTYTVDFSQTPQELLAGLGDQFACKAEIINGKLTLTDREVGTSQLAIDSISYTNAQGATPATAAGIAQIFGVQGASFVVAQEDRYSDTALSTTNYASPSSTIYLAQEGGFDRGILQTIRVDGEGNIFGQYSNGREIKQAQLILANFNNLQGLRTVGGNTFAATDESGLAILATPGVEGLGRVSNNNLEASNVDLGKEMTNLVITQRAFQANSKSITTADEIYQEILRLLRR